MAEPLRAGSAVSAGTYRCTTCGKEIALSWRYKLPPCSRCENRRWWTVSGGGVRRPRPERAYQPGKKATPPTREGRRSRTSRVGSVLDVYARHLKTRSRV
jgi:DNA-directed RNA polymerase subunit RPC12/RpoP